MRVRSKGLLAAAVMLACLMAGNAAGAAQKRERSPATESLFLAITANDLGAVKTSLLAGADVEAENDSGRTPVDVAVDLGNFPIAHYLLAWRKNLASQRERKATIACKTPGALALVAGFAGDGEAGVAGDGAAASGLAAGAGG